MKWVPYPSNIADDPRMIAAGEAAEVLWTRAWGYSGEHDTDGLIPDVVIARLCPTRTRARLAALLEHELLVECDGGYKLTDWAAVTADVRGMEVVREQAAARAKRYRDRKKAAAPEQPDPPSTVTAASRDGGMTSHGQEEKEITTPPTPPASQGDCDPTQPIHATGCRACGTNPRAGRPDAAAELAAQHRAVAAHNDARAALAWCGDCERPEYRWTTTDRGVAKCAACHPDLVIGPHLDPPSTGRHLTVVSARSAS